MRNRSYVANGPRYSSTTALRNPTYMNRTRFSGNRTTAFNAANYSRGNGRLAAGRTHGPRTQGFNNNHTRERVVARHSANWQRNWDRRRDHNWRGHRCHFHNGFWFVYDPFPWYGYSYPYSWDYYPYAASYDPGYVDDAYADGAYQEDGQYSRDQNVTGSQITAVQRALAREGYYDGAVDGVFGPGTRRALRNYQRDHGLEATGGITQSVIESLRLR